MNKNRLLAEFFQDDRNRKLYQEYLRNPTGINQKILDERFKEFYFRIRSIAYILKSLHFESQKLDRKNRLYKQRYQSILDRPNEDNSTLLDLIEVPPPREETHSNKLEDYITDFKLHSSIKKLTNKQREILFYVFVMELKDVEIAKTLAVSQQFVTNTKNVALKKLRGEMNDVR
ncbi:RNA polymerase subunit sigma-70 [Paenisporosarcina sp. FSL H8-0542]|uniref:RNA polymerase subunit sigma-70 n=1 Tax=Paenisporosarcina sp. FSL H8-0542 TaxID=2921401 RepID=UPI00315A6216